jgi:tetratricopeptide (TPR) repeat protein
VAKTERLGDLAVPAGDIDGAIADLLKAIESTKGDPLLSEETELSYNYLAAELYLNNNSVVDAERAIREAIGLARTRESWHLPDHLLILGPIQIQKKEYDNALGVAEEARRIYGEQNHSHGVSQARELIAKAMTFQRTEKNQS